MAVDDLSSCVIRYLADFVYVVAMCEGTSLISPWKDLNYLKFNRRLGNGATRTPDKVIQMMKSYTSDVVTYHYLVAFSYGNDGFSIAGEN